MVTPPIFDFTPKREEFNYDTVLTAYGRDGECPQAILRGVRQAGQSEQHHLAKHDAHRMEHLASSPWRSCCGLQHRGFGSNLPLPPGGLIREHGRHAMLASTAGVAGADHAGQVRAGQPAAAHVPGWKANDQRAGFFKLHHRNLFKPPFPRLPLAVRSQLRNRRANELKNPLHTHHSWPRLKFLFDYPPRQ